jgi:putative serine/threonine protein kinase
LKTSFAVLTENLGKEPYASILCYPKTSEAELQNRLAELKTHGVKAVDFVGRTCAFNVPVVGKGFVGIVVKARLNRRTVALKIRRVDADRQGLQHEAEMLAKANSVDVGPKLVGVSTNFLLMQFIDGCLLPDWLERPIPKERVRGVLSKVLEQCWRLDAIGLDHGELSKAPKHLMINRRGEPFMVDFETASLNRRSSNVTSICQYLFISGAVSRLLAEKLGDKNKKTIVEALKLYKTGRNREDFEKVLEACDL